MFKFGHRLIFIAPMFLLFFEIPVSFAVSDFELESVSGKHFIVGTFEIPPYIYIRRDSDGKLQEVGGFVHEVLVFLARKLNFTFEYVESNGSTGSCSNGTCNGLIGMLTRGDIDIAATGLSLTESRSRVIDFSFQFDADFKSLLIPYPKKEDALGNIILPFRCEVVLFLAQVWILILLSLLISAFAMSCIVYFEKLTLFYGACNNQTGRLRSVARRKKFTDFIFFLIGLLINTGNKLLPGYGASVRIVISVWCLGAVVLAISYSISVKSYLTMPSHTPPVIKSIEELADKPDYNFIVLKYNSIWSQITTATSGSLEKIGETLRKHPENSLENLDNATNLVIHHKKILGMFHSFNLVRIEQDMKETGGQCRLYIAEKHFDAAQICFGFPKKSKLKRLLSSEIMWIQQSGLLSYWKSIYWPRTNRCSAPIPRKPLEKAEKLTLNSLSGAFLLLGSGMLISFLVFLLEIINYRWHQRRVHLLETRVAQTER